MKKKTWKQYKAKRRKIISASLRFEMKQRFGSEMKRNEAKRSEKSVFVFRFNKRNRSETEFFRFEQNSKFKTGAL
jgi:hypothetical protein